MDSALIIEKSVIIGIVFAITMVMAMYSTLAERKIAAWLQDRIGPNRAGKGGLLQPLADGLKLFSKEEFERLMSKDKLNYIILKPDEMRLKFTEFVMMNQPLALDEAAASLL